MVDLDIFSNLGYNNITEILYKDRSGDWAQLERIEHQPSDKISIGYFVKESIKAGTGFVVKVLNGPGACALILTAAHIFLDGFVFSSQILEFVLEGETFMANPLITSLDFDDENQFWLDPLSNNKISVPNDFCICELHQIPGRAYKNKITALKLYEAVNKIPERTTCIVFGYPLPISANNQPYIAPSSTPSELNRIKDCIHNGEWLVQSNGEIIAYEQMCCISCPTANGMSGSPILIEDGPEWKVVGILHGGPAALFHKPIIQILNKLQRYELKNEILDFMRKVEEYLEEKKKLGHRIPRSYKYLKNALKILQKDIKNNRSPDRESLRLLRSCYSNCINSEMEMGANFNYNLCVPVCNFYNQAFEAMRRYN